jgi:hypothetical protein
MRVSTREHTKNRFSCQPCQYHSLAERIWERAAFTEIFKKPHSRSFSSASRPEKMGGIKLLGRGDISG